MCTQNWRKYKQLLTNRQFTLLGGSISAQETTARSLLATSIPSVVYQRNRASDNPGAGSEEVGSETFCDSTAEVWTKPSGKQSGRS